MADVLPISGRPDWRLLEVDGALVATAGTDEVWLVDDAPGALLAELAPCWSKNPPRPSELSPGALRAVEQLRALGAIGPPELPARPSTRTVFCGTPSAAWAQAWAAAAPTVDAQDADLVVVVRTSGRWAELADLAATFTAGLQPHVVVDLAAARTVALGPLGVPGHTACAGCLAGRVAARWGDPQPPAEPKAAHDPAATTVAAHLLARHIGAGKLVNQQVSLSLDELSLIASPVLLSANCPCAPVVTAGRVALPWL